MNGGKGEEWRQTGMDRLQKKKIISLFILRLGFEAISKSKSEHIF